MATSQDVPIPFRIIAMMQEQNRLFAYPLEHLAMEIRATGFGCDCCGACCKRAVNPHIFLLEHDVNEVKKIDPAAYEPAPDPEFCDQNGMLYVSGYALRMNDRTGGSCWFLDEGRCRIYDRRFSGCRIYPHMLRRSVDVTGEATWLKFARKNKHGRSDQALSPEDCTALAQKVKEYENAFLAQQISFLETLHEYFTVHDLRHDPATHECQMQNFSRGKEVSVMVYHAGEFYRHRYKKLL
ncbi:MAG: YkgJ family cysteine cluster protein [Methanoregula sp.]|jgi:hypothetical protein